MDNGDMLNKMKEKRKWKNVQNEEGKKNIELNNELQCEIEKAKVKWMKDRCCEIGRLQQEAGYDLIIYKAAIELFFRKKERSNYFYQIE